ncbi:MAG TPA: twin-arginine translocase TatA/TatE family subunit [Opitutus sp.]|nr:twin-arginine translocase TatA/TatE family subunit [Opitutus sp.]
MANIPAILAAWGFSGGELLIVLLIILVLFGGAKLPSLAKGLGQSIKEFKKASRDDDETKSADTKTAAESKKPEPTNVNGAH